VQFPSETNNIIRSVEEKPGLCHNCVISGHWQRDCWKRKCDSMRSGQEKQGPSKGKWNQGNSPNDTMLVLKFKNLSPSQQQSLLDALEVNSQTPSLRPISAGEHMKLDGKYPTVQKFGVT
jgi:hypothetical protein